MKRGSLASPATVLASNEESFTRSVLLCFSSSNFVLEGTANEPETSAFKGGAFGTYVKLKLFWKTSLTAEGVVAMALTWSPLELSCLLPLPDPGSIRVAVPPLPEPDFCSTFEGDLDGMAWILLRSMICDS